MCIPSPTVLHFRLEPGAVDKKAYPNSDAIFSDLSAAYRKAVKAFYDAGCRYLQFDDTAWAYLCSDVEMKKAKERGMNVATIADDYTRVINDSIKDKPADMVITTHVCRGNFRSTWISSGGYEPVAETHARPVQLRRLFPGIRQRARRRLRAAALPAEGQEDRVVGVITSKSGTLESKDTVKRRIDEASKFAPLEQLALSPQCGFASTEEGNVLTEEQQWAKMREVVEVAKRFGGSKRTAIARRHPREPVIHSREDLRR